VARVLLGVTGGIAAYKACELVRLLVQDGHEVKPVLTPDAERFVTAHTFEALARREAARDLYPHLADADLLVIAPLSANTLAKLAHGLRRSSAGDSRSAAPSWSPGDERPHVGAPGQAGLALLKSARPRDQAGGGAGRGRARLSGWPSRETMFAAASSSCGRRSRRARLVTAGGRGSRSSVLHRQPLLRKMGVALARRRGVGGPR
jgi:hypothetical protein